MDYVNSATNTLTAGVQSLGQGIQNAKTSVATGLGEFSSKNVIKRVLGGK